ncbi:hypothetical protein DL89DRAFT_268097 [Linderina pennispora]|uniref:Uncharacterized protein n=1 Tax=Linderina pennispora TaxID=61395 RepID=A0A1Y1W6W2_9FUNG|nr:uncharacterized protein DL89DRAFT_268097 [Linderina pennispora]ORX69068.1 hypothetical protein DL89DRAFT_268097 [Linderina pennispora]
MHHPIEFSLCTRVLTNRKYPHFATVESRCSIVRLVLWAGNTSITLISAVCVRAD